MAINSCEYGSGNRLFNTLYCEHEEETVGLGCYFCIGWGREYHRAYFLGYTLKRMDFEIMYYLLDPNQFRKRILSESENLEELLRFAKEQHINGVIAQTYLEVSEEQQLPRKEGVMNHG